MGAARCPADDGGRAKLKEIMASPDPMAAALEAGASMHVSRRGIDMRLPAPPAPPQRIEATIEFAKPEPAGITLDESQRQALAIISRSAIAVLTGGPGTGKTTITKQVVSGGVE